LITSQFSVTISPRINSRSSATLSTTTADLFSAQDPGLQKSRINDEAIAAATAAITVGVSGGSDRFTLL
jgi:hypothetical protein